MKYQAVYLRIDLVYYGNQGRLEHDFLVAPGADPRRIKLRVSGEAKPRIGAEGDLLLTVNQGAIWLHKPRVYQDQPGGRQSVHGRYVLKRGNQLGFDPSTQDSLAQARVSPEPCG